MLVCLAARPQTRSEARSAARRCRRGACLGRAGPLCAPPLPTGAPRAGAGGGSGALRLLLACGADADARDEAGDRPLHLVCRAGIDLQTYPHGDDLQALPHSIALHYIDAAKRAATAHKFGAHDLSAQTRPGPSASGVADSAHAQNWASPARLAAKAQHICAAASVQHGPAMVSMRGRARFRAWCCVLPASRADRSSSRCFWALFKMCRPGACAAGSSRKPVLPMMVQPCMSRSWRRPHACCLTPARPRAQARCSRRAPTRWRATRPARCRCTRPRRPGRSPHCTTCSAAPCAPGRRPPGRPLQESAGGRAAAPRRARPSSGAPCPPRRRRAGGCPGPDCVACASSPRMPRAARRCTPPRPRRTVRPRAALSSFLLAMPRAGGTCLQTQARLARGLQVRAFLVLDHRTAAIFGCRPCWCARGSLLGGQTEGMQACRLPPRLLRVRAERPCAARPGRRRGRRGNRGAADGVRLRPRGARRPGRLAAARVPLRRGRGRAAARRRGGGRALPRGRGAAALGRQRRRHVRPLRAVACAGPVAGRAADVRLQAYVHVARACPTEPERAVWG